MDKVSNCILANGKNLFNELFFGLREACYTCYKHPLVVAVPFGGPKSPIVLFEQG